MSLRAQLTQVLSRYVSETFTYINTVRQFNLRRWVQERESEYQEMDQIKIKNKRRTDPGAASEAIVNAMKDTFTPGAVETEEADLEFDLFTLLQQTLAGLQTLQDFLNAVERLSVTSVHVFDPKTVINMSEEQLRKVQTIISDSTKICPLLLLFKRDNEAFFSFRLQNLDTLQNQLNTYIINVEIICNQFTDSPSWFVNPVISLNVDLSEENMRNMLRHIHQLQELREDEAFRTVFMFKEKHHSFMKEYSERRPHMDGFLSEVEQCATELDNMKKGKEISGVVSGSLGVTGGVLAIVGLALLPVTFGASAVLLATGAGMAGVSGGTSIATLIADRTVNSRETGKAQEAFEKFKDNMNALQRCLNTISTINFNKGEGRTVDGILKFGSAVTKGTQTATQIGKAAVTTAEAAAKVARAGFIAVNALFIGFDVATIALNSRDLYKGRESESSKLIRAKAELWKSEIESWEKIYQSLERGLQSSKGKQETLQTPFYHVPASQLQQEDPFRYL